MISREPISKLRATLSRAVRPIAENVRHIRSGAIILSALGLTGTGSLLAAQAMGEPAQTAPEIYPWESVLDCNVKESDEIKRCLLPSTIAPQGKKLSTRMLPRDIFTITPGLAEVKGETTVATRIAISDPGNAARIGLAVGNGLSLGEEVKTGVYVQGTEIVAVAPNGTETVIASLQLPPKTVNFAVTIGTDGRVVARARADEMEIAPSAIVSDANLIKTTDDKIHATVEAGKNSSATALQATLTSKE